MGMVRVGGWHFRRWAASAATLACHGEVQSAMRWYCPYPADDERRKVRVPTHLVLMSGFAMPAAEQATPPEVGSGKGKSKVKWGLQHRRYELVQKGAVVMGTDVHSAINDRN